MHSEETVLHDPVDEVHEVRIEDVREEHEDGIVDVVPEP